MKNSGWTNCTEKECVNFISSLASAAESLVERCSGTDQSVLLKSTDTAVKCCEGESKMEFCRGSRSGKMSRTLTESRGKGSLTSSVQDSPAQPFPQPGNAREKKTAATFGQKLPESYAKWHRDSRFWKTCRGFLPLTISAKSLVTWRRWGSMRNGELYQQRPWELGIPAIDCGYLATVGILPTPTANPPNWKNIEIVDKNGNAPEHYNQRFYDKNTGRLVQKGLHQVMNMFPTPTASNTIQPSEERLQKLRDGETTRNVPTGGEPCNLQERVLLINRGWFKKDGLFPTLTASNGFRGSGVGVGASHRPLMLGCPGDVGYGMLNPNWLAWLMGFPINWTTLEPLETHKFRKWLRLHS